MQEVLHYFNEQQGDRWQDCAKEVAISGLLWMCDHPGRERTMEVWVFMEAAKLGCGFAILVNATPHHPVYQGFCGEKVFTIHPPEVSCP